MISEHQWMYITLTNVDGDLCCHMLSLAHNESTCSYVTWCYMQQNPGGGTHYMKVTIYAPPFRPPFFGSLENLYSFDPYILAKMRKMSYFDPYFSSKLGKMYSFDPPFSTLVAFRVGGRCWASLSKTWPSTPPGSRTDSTSQSMYTWFMLVELSCSQVYLLVVQMITFRAPSQYKDRLSRV